MAFACGNGGNLLWKTMLWDVETEAFCCGKPCFWMWKQRPFATWKQRPFAVDNHAFGRGKGGLLLWKSMLLDVEKEAFGRGKLVETQACGRGKQHL